MFELIKAIIAGLIACSVYILVPKYKVDVSLAVVALLSAILVVLIL